MTKPGREGYLKEDYRYFHLRDTAGQERDFHFHEFDKAVLLLDGRVDYTVEEKTYSLHPGDILCVPHHTIHRAEIDRSKPYERVILYIHRSFTERYGLEDLFSPGRHLFTPEGEEAEELKKALTDYEKAEKDRDYGASVMRDSIFLQILVRIGRAGQGQIRVWKREHDPRLGDTVSFINAHLSEDITVDTLAERVYLSRYYFMRLFKEENGVTVHAYLRQKRLLYAARLIREGIPAGKAAMESGFGDYSAFHRAFRELFGVTPAGLQK